MTFAPLRYPAAWLVAAAAVAAALARHGVSALGFYHAAFALLLAAVTAVDLRHQIIPNRFILCGLALGFVGPFGLRSLPLGSAAWGLALAGGSFALIALVSRGAIGGGDVKLAAVIGWVLGPAATVVALALAVLAGGAAALVLLLTGRVRRGDFIPYGPFLAGGAFVAALWGDAIIRWWWRGN